MTEDNFLEKLKQAIKNAYETGGEAAGDAYNKAGDWAELLSNKARTDMENLDPEVRELIDQAAFSSPAMGITKAVKMLGPTMGKAINKAEPIISDVAFGKGTGEGLTKHAKGIIDYFNRAKPEMKDKMLGNLKKVAELSDEGRFPYGNKSLDESKQISDEMYTYLTKTGDELPEMIAAASKGVKSPKKVPTDILGLPDDLQSLNKLLEHYTNNNNPDIVNSIQQKIKWLQNK